MNRDDIETADNVKFQLLQGERAWKSLDETRRCVLCEQTFTGRQVCLFWDGSGAPHLQCPTAGCPGTPAQWVHPDNPLISEEAWRDWVRLLDTLCEEPIRQTFGVRKGRTVRKIKRLEWGAPKMNGMPKMPAPRTR